MKKEPGYGVEEKSNGGGLHTFRLYITGASPNSSRAVTNLKVFFEKYLKSRYKLQIIDIYQQPQVAESVNIIALPLLIRKSPLPERRMIGDMSNEEKICQSLGLANLAI